MSVDWNNLVLGPCMDQFALTDASVDPNSTGQVQLNPLKSQPGVAAYGCRAVWEVVQYTIVEDNDAPMSTSVFKVGLRLSEFAVPPVQGDQMVIAGDVYTLDTFEFDGQGGVRWVVKAAAPHQETQYAT